MLEFAGVRERSWARTRITLPVVWLFSTMTLGLHPHPSRPLPSHLAGLEHGARRLGLDLPLRRRAAAPARAPHLAGAPARRRRAPAVAAAVLGARRAIALRRRAPRRRRPPLRRAGRDDAALALGPDAAHLARGRHLALRHRLRAGPRGLGERLRPGRGRRQGLHGVRRLRAHRGRALPRRCPLGPAGRWLYLAFMAVAFLLGGYGWIASRRATAG